jgi:HK97 family phage prohead protease
VSDNFDIKSIDLEIKNDEKGEVAAVFSVFDKVDSDGDIVKAGSIKSGFKSGDVPMVWAHKWDMPIGKGQIEQDDDKATFKGQFFMDTESGREAYNLVKAMGELQQWSFGFKVDDSEYGKFKKDGSDEEEDVRFLKGLTVYEVSPVLVGANQETYTMAIKSNTDLLEELSGEKAVMTTESMNQPDPEEEEAPAEEEAIDEVDTEFEEVSEDQDAEAESIAEETAEEEEEKELKVSEEVNKTFSEEVKDVLAALENLITRAKAISSLREKDGRKLGEKATEALRAVQDDLSDAWAELDSFVDEFGAEEVSESEVEEQPTGDVDVDENTVVNEYDNDVSDIDSEEEETEEIPVSEVTEETEDNSESADEDFDAEWVEGQRLIAETVDIEV